MPSQSVTKSELSSFDKKTRRALLWMNLSHEPFVVLYAILPFILRKDLQGSLLQISILSALRPILAVFSFYWSANLTNRRGRLRSNLIGAWVLARVPFLFILCFDNAWYLIFCCAVYELFNKSGIPALIEILKINISKESRERTFTFYFVLCFLESILLGILMAGMLEKFSSGWQVFCFATALLGLSSVIVQLRIPIPNAECSQIPIQSTKNALIQPWKEAFALLKHRHDFARFQWGFMIGGFGLMFIAPSLSIFYVDNLNLSHFNIVIGRSILMGVGIVLSSYFWRKGLAKKSVDELTRNILFGFGLFPLAMVFSLFQIEWFYLSFIIYGIAQAGSHLLWNLSGTLFANDEDSSQFSRVNILMLGLRGAIAPALGGIMCSWSGPVAALIIGAIFCIVGAWYMNTKKHALIKPA